MKKNDTPHPQLSQVLLVLQNINDNLRRIEESLSDIKTKLNNSPQKHLVVIKKEKGENKNAKV